MEEALAEVVVVAQAGEGLETVGLAHLFEEGDGLGEEAGVVEVAVGVFGVGSVDDLAEEGVDVVGRHSADVFHAVVEHVGVVGVDAVVEAFLFVLVLRKGGTEGGPAVGVLAAAVVLEGGGEGEPLVESVVVGVVVGVGFVDLVEVGLVGSKIDKLVDVAGFGGEILEGRF